MDKKDNYKLLQLEINYGSLEKFRPGQLQELSSDLGITDELLFSSFKGEIQDYEQHSFCFNSFKKRMDSITNEVGIYVKEKNETIYIVDRYLLSNVLKKDSNQEQHESKNYNSDLKKKYVDRSINYLLEICDLISCFKLTDCLTIRILTIHDDNYLTTLSEIAQSLNSCLKNSHRIKMEIVLVQEANNLTRIMKNNFFQNLHNRRIYTSIFNASIEHALFNFVSLKKNELNSLQNRKRLDRMHINFNFLESHELTRHRHIALYILERYYLNREPIADYDLEYFNLSKISSDNKLEEKPKSFCFLSND
jgi:hypothetical protein